MTIAPVSLKKTTATPVTIHLIDPSSSSDLDAASSVYYAAFDPFEAFSDVVEPPPRAPQEDRVRRYSSRLRKMFSPGKNGEESSHVGYKAVLDSGEIVGMGYWMRPGNHHHEMVPGQMSEEVEEMYRGWDVKKYSDLYQAFQVKMDQVCLEAGEKGCWYLAILAIHPDHQGKRIGTRLIDHHLAWLDSLSPTPENPSPITAAYLESSPEGERLYRSRKFVDYGICKAEGWEDGFPAMLRPGRFRD